MTTSAAISRKRGEPARRGVRLRGGGAWTRTRLRGGCLRCRSGAAWRRAAWPPDAPGLLCASMGLCASTGPCPSMGLCGPMVGGAERVRAAVERVGPLGCRRAAGAARPTAPAVP